MPTHLTCRLENIRRSTVYGVRQDRTWRQAATRFLEEYSHQRPIWHPAIFLKQLDLYIGEIEMFSEKGSRQPHPLSWEERKAFFLELPPRL